MKNFHHIQQRSYVKRGHFQYENLSSLENKIVYAEYVHAPIEIDSGNPYIEALPKPRELEQIRDELETGIANFSTTEEIRKPVWKQLADVTQLRNVRYLLPFNLQLETDCYNLLINSYRLRYMFADDATNVNYSMHDTSQLTHGRLVGESADAANAGFSLIGYSGCGKSTALKTLFAHYPQVILHRGVGSSTYPQIVYLVVNCPPHSNFRGLYKNIGIEIDRALGNIIPVYEKELDAGGSGNLARYTEKVRHYIEQFAIGVIVFDEVQNINFNSSTENSFESLLELTNETKVAFGVVGTEDAKEKIFSNHREARRLGTQIKADSYCSNRNIFNQIAMSLFEYQWFKEPIEPSEEILDSLYEYSKGIIDQLVGIYQCMQADYITAHRKPTIDAEYVKKTARKHYPGIETILSSLDISTDAEQKRVELTLSAAQQLEATSQAARAAYEMHKYTDSLGNNDVKENRRVRDEVVQTIKTVAGDKYNDATIRKAFNQIIATQAGKKAASDITELTRLVFANLQTKPTDRRAHYIKPKVNTEKAVRFPTQLDEKEESTEFIEKNESESDDSLIE
ncbi:MAG: ATP-binding protein [Prevotella sp.]|jgi:hypothetical protein|nr:ATP-binding protein [Prevotella sp.]MCH4183421.1 ATP-binding protein [Prevotella sp.]